MTRTGANPDHINEPAVNYDQNEVCDSNKTTGQPQRQPETLAGVIERLRRDGVASHFTEGKKVLATYSVPLGPNEATIVFKGDQLSPDDFDALADYVSLFKKQYERKLKSEAMKGAESMKDVAINMANLTGDSDYLSGEKA